MIQLPNPDDMRRLRACLDDNGYDAENVTERLGSPFPPTPADVSRALYLTREANAANALLRLFLIGTSLDESLARESLPADVLDWSLGSGLLRAESGRVRAAIVIVPVEGLRIASDAFEALGTDAAAEFVPPASTHAANYLRHLTLREPVERTLDLGCGCGIQALFAAAHSDAVVATDINEAAIRYTQFNAMLNGIDNVECRRGDFFDAAAGERFDLIVCNPPFVPGPGRRFVYRDNPLELDSLCRQLLREAPGHLEDGGHLQMLCESVEIEGEAWQDRMQSWVHDTGCDTWLLHNPPVPPATYVGRRAADVVEASDAAAAGDDAWRDYFASQQVTAIHPGLFVLRRREGENWLHVHNLAGDVTGPAGDAVRRGIAACDFLERCRDDDALLQARVAISPQLTLEQQFARAEESWRPRMSLLRMDDGLAMDAEVDLPVLAFVNQLDGTSTVRESIERFATSVGAEFDRLAADLLPVVRLFVGRGFLLPAAAP